MQGERDRARAEVKRLSGVLSEERTTRQLVEDRLGRTLDELGEWGILNHTQRIDGQLLDA